MMVGVAKAEGSSSRRISRHKPRQLVEKAIETAGHGHVGLCVREAVAPGVVLLRFLHSGETLMRVPHCSRVCFARRYERYWFRERAIR